MERHPSRRRDGGERERESDLRWARDEQREALEAEQREEVRAAEEVEEEQACLLA